MYRYFTISNLKAAKIYEIILGVVIKRRPHLQKMTPLPQDLSYDRNVSVLPQPTTLTLSYPCGHSIIFENS